MPSNDISARMPPSPSLSARITIATYLIEVVMTSVHTISDSMPSTAAGVASPPRPCDRRLESVERARADVAVDHAKSRKRHGGEMAARRRLLCGSRNDRHHALLGPSKGSRIGRRPGTSASPPEAICQDLYDVFIGMATPVVELCAEFPQLRPRWGKLLLCPLSCGSTVPVYYQPY